MFTPPVPETWAAYLPEERLGDRALEALFDDLVDGRVRRAGERLASFGIQWVVFTEESPLETLFEAQLDLIPIRSLEFPVFRNEVPAARAVADTGAVWPGDGTGYRRPEGVSPTTSVYVAENADFRWGPGTWEQDGWANSVTVAAGVVEFSGHTGRRMLATGAAAWLGLLFATWLVAGRWRR